MACHIPVAYRPVAILKHIEGLAESKAQTQELMTKTKELQSEGSRLTVQKNLAERMREKFTLTNKVRGHHIHQSSIRIIQISYHK